MKGKGVGEKNSFYGRTHSEESKRKMSESSKGKIPWNKGKTNIYSKESLKKMSESSKGAYEEKYGKEKALEIKDKISIKLKQRKLSAEHKRKIGLKTKARLTGKTFEEVHGVKKAAEIKRKIGANNWAKKMKGNFSKETLEKKRQNLLGDKNPMYGLRKELSPFWRGGDKASSKKSYRNNIEFRLKKLIRTRLRQVLNRQLNGGKKYSSEYYGIDIQKIIEHLKKQIPEDYFTKDYDIHHIQKLSKFDLNNPQELIKAFSPENHLIILKKEHKEHHIKHNDIHAP